MPQNRPKLVDGSLATQEVDGIAAPKGWCRAQSCRRCYHRKHATARLVPSTTLLSVLLVLPAAAQEGGTWTTLAPLQIPRQEVGAARIGGRVFVVGGLVAGGVPTETVEVYDIRRDRWSQSAPLPVPLDHLGVAAVGGRLFVFGGFSTDRSARDQSYVYEPAADRWAQIASMPAPRGAPWAAAFQGRIYVFGGVDGAGRVQASTFIYDPGGDVWLEGAPMPTAREHLNATVRGRFIYVVGGRDVGSTPALERYEPANDRWRSLMPMPTARSAAAVATLGGKIYVMGGETPQLFEVNEVYDPSTDRWSLAPPMPVPRHGVAAVTLDDAILVPGGGTIQGLFPSAHVDTFHADVPSHPGDPGQVGFARVVLPSREDDGSVSVTVVREGGSTGPLAVDWTMEDLSATAGSDYDTGSGRLEWGDGDSKPKSFEISLVDDDVEEPSELLRLVLREPSGLDDLLFNDSAAIVILDDDRSPACRPDSQTLCLLDRRFRAEVSWRDPRSGLSGVGGALEELGQTGIFWFFDPENFELVVKVLDGRALTGAFWLFYGALSDIEYWIVVSDTESDTESGAVRIFHNPPFRLASFADVGAFPESAIPDSGQGSSMADHPGGAHPLGSARRESVHGSPGSCVADVETLCLLDGRFEVEVTWQTTSGQTIPGQALPRTDESGLFWFFAPENVELVVKILDGRAINGHLWLFYGALSDVGYTLTATDTLTGESKVYVNEQGTLASVADVAAFDG